MHSATQSGSCVTSPQAKTAHDLVVGHAGTVPPGPGMAQLCAPVVGAGPQTSVAGAASAICASAGMTNFGASMVGVVVGASTVGVLMSPVDDEQAASARARTSRLILGSYPDL